MQKCKLCWWLQSEKRIGNLHFMVKKEMKNISSESLFMSNQAFLLCNTFCVKVTLKIVPKIFMQMSFLLCYL